MKINNVVLAKDFEEVVACLANDSENNIIIGGGLWQRMNRQQYDNIIDLSKLSLSYIESDEETIRIGASSTLRMIEENKEIKKLYNGILSDAIGKIMGVSVRNVATIGGSVMGRYAFSDIIPCLLAVEATLVFYPNQSILLEDWIHQKPDKTAILKEIRIKKCTGKGYFHKVGRTHLDFALINVAIVKDHGYKIIVGARPSIAQKAEKAMKHINNIEMLNDEDIEKVADIAIEELKFGSNNKASKEYRKRLAKTYIIRGVKEVESI
jgi:CO/xanthine dehydrogenase FAD-binding subunit